MAETDAGHRGARGQAISGRRRPRARRSDRRQPPRGERWGGGQGREVPAARLLRPRSLRILKPASSGHSASQQALPPPQSPGVRERTSPSPRSHLSPRAGPASRPGAERSLHLAVGAGPGRPCRPRARLERGPPRAGSRHRPVGEFAGPCSGGIGVPSRDGRGAPRRQRARHVPGGNSVAYPPPLVGALRLEV